MRNNIWCLIAPMFLVSVRAGLHDHVAQSFFETPQSSSPAPAPTEATPPQLVGMKEIVLFLTPDQVRTLQEAGAVVKPYPEYESEFAELQEKVRQSIEQEKAQQYDTATPYAAEQQEGARQTYYNLLNIQEINDDLTQQTQTTEGITERTATTPRYKYTKSRQQYKEKEYVQKKSSRTKSSNQNNSEYVRFLPNYENENLQMIPYHALPLPAYQPELANVYIQPNEKPGQSAFTQENIRAQQNAYTQENVQAQQHAYTQANEAERSANEESLKHLYAQANEEAKQKAYSQANAEAQQVAYAEANREVTPNPFSQANEEAKQNAYNQANTEGQRQVLETRQRHETPQKEATEKPQALVEVPAPVLSRKPEIAQTYLRPQDSTQFKETLSSIEGIPPFEEQQEKPEPPHSPVPTVQTPILIQDKLSLLLAPLYQHQAITESISRQREELLRNEYKIHNKLQQIKQSPEYNHEEYATEVEKLARNLGKQNALAQIEAMSKSPSVYLNQETTESRPIAFGQSTAFPVSSPVLVRVPKPLEVNIPAPYPAPIGFVRPVAKQDGFRTENNVPGARNVYFKLDQPHTVPKFIPFPSQGKIPVKTNGPDHLTVIRHIWEH